MFRLVGGGALICLVAVTVDAQAQSAATGVESTMVKLDVWDETLALTGDLGFGIPVGYVGAEVDYSLVSLLALHGGIGLGKGPQVAGGVRVRPVRGNVTAFGIGAGFSLGNSDLVDPKLAHPESRITYEYRPGYFLNLDLLVEHRWSSHFVMREFLGYARVLNGHPDDVCPESSVCRSGATSKGLAGTPYMGLAFGYYWGGRSQ